MCFKNGKLYEVTIDAPNVVKDDAIVNNRIEQTFNTNNVNIRIKTDDENVNRIAIIPW